MYEWEGKIENDSEVLMMIKTRTVRVAELTEFVKSMTTITFDSVWNKYELHPNFQRTTRTTCARSSQPPSRTATRSTSTGSGKLCQLRGKQKGARKSDPTLMFSYLLLYPLSNKIKIHSDGFVPCTLSIVVFSKPHER